MLETILHNLTNIGWAMLIFCVPTFPMYPFLCITISKSCWNRSARKS